MSNTMLNYEFLMKNYLKMLEFLKGHRGTFWRGHYFYHPLLVV